MVAAIYAESRRDTLHWSQSSRSGAGVASCTRNPPNGAAKAHPSIRQLALVGWISPLQVLCLLMGLIHIEVGKRLLYSCFQMLVRWDTTSLESHDDMTTYLLFTASPDSPDRSHLGTDPVVRKVKSLVFHQGRHQVALTLRDCTLSKLLLAFAMD